MMLYQVSPRRRLTLTVRPDDDPYDGEFAIDPYDVVLEDPAISLVTLVTPDVGSPFVQRLIGMFLDAAETPLPTAVAEQPGPGGAVDGGV